MEIHTRQEQFDTENWLNASGFEDSQLLQTKTNTLCTT